MWAYRRIVYACKRTVRVHAGGLHLCVCICSCVCARGLIACACKRIMCVCMQEDCICVCCCMYAYRRTTCVCMHMCMQKDVCMCAVCACTCPHMWIKCPPLSLPTLFFQIGSLTEPGAHYQLHGWSVTFRELPVSLPLLPSRTLRPQGTATI